MTNQAVREQRPYLRSISLPATPFLEAIISKMMSTQRRIDTFVPCMIVPVVAENWRRQGRQFQVRRSLIDPLEVRREWPFIGTTRYTSIPWQVGQKAPFGHRNRSIKAQASASV